MERRGFLKAVVGGVVAIGEAWFVPVSLNALDSRALAVGHSRRGAQGLEIFGFVFAAGRLIGEWG